ncbi:hypothetical protein CC53_gp160 [Rhizobium phage vB_RleS_L338C]|uniref:hypothetical protein n=1 Tax=Rhizobium phage vB_RleS_L338C TaxID=1414737 RepID=UPI0003D9328B|nr:hypothetical protein CC53_gp160 [Rhizobium phage vB_RleS_L338C]AHC30577.1 hypothetical protein L338C_160 [Rhizobium phage vB_RleS_L338C]QNH72117.1 hypothetical protein P11VFA_159 [Rhizobium phage P11VFA]
MSISMTSPRRVRLGKDLEPAKRFVRPDKIAVAITIEALDKSRTSGGWCHPNRPENMEPVWEKLSELCDYYHEKEVPFNVWYQVELHSMGVVVTTGSWQQYPRVLEQAQLLLEECLKAKGRIDAEDYNKERVEYRGG